MNYDLEHNLAALVSDHPAFTYVISKLQDTPIRYGLYAGSHISILSSSRISTDIDILVHDSDMAVLRSLFPFAKTTDKSDGIFLYVGRDDVIEFMGCADVVRDGSVYPFRLTDTAATKLISHHIGNLHIKVVDPADTLLLKALLQRGPEQGKHDWEDIEALIKAVDINTTYLKTRIHESKAKARVEPVLHKYRLT